MNDPFNPTAAELEAWSLQPTAQQPVEDWDLIITDEENLEVIYRLAGDTTRAQWHFFLGCLYLFVADAWRTGFSAYPRIAVESLLSRVPEDAPSHLLRWRQRCRELLAGRCAYDYVLWCGHGYAGQERQNAG